MNKWEDPRYLTTMPEHGILQPDGTIKSVEEVANKLSQTHGAVTVEKGATDTAGNPLEERDAQGRVVGGYVTIRKP